MRLLDGSKDNDDSSSKPKKSGESDDGSSNSDSSSTTSLSFPSTANSSGNAKNGRISRQNRKNRMGNRKYGWKSGKSRSKNPNIANGTINGSEIYTNGFLHSKRRKHSIGGGKSSKYKGKKLPTNPTPIPNIYNNDQDDEATSKIITPIHKGNRTASDMDLVDYEDYASSLTSSRSITPSYEENFHLQSFGDSRKIISSKSGAKYEGDESFRTLYEKDLIEFHNAPCSSSSLRERLNSQFSLHSTPSTSKAASKTSKTSEVIMIPVSEENYETIISKDYATTGGVNGSESNQQYKSESQSQSESQTKLGVSNDTDKYVHSGMGRHFGKKRKSSLNDLSDGEGSSFGGGGINGGDSDFEWLFSWFLRLKAVTIVFLGTLCILSLASLLFVFPILVDPILLGLEAEFSQNPVTCRTTNLRNGKGPVECTLPSCRAGCTADIFQCIFIEVIYFYEVDLDSHLISSTLRKNNSESSSLSKSDSDFHSNFTSSTDLSTDSNSTKTFITKNATLFININGCGYPPEVNCSLFILTYGAIGTEFDCFYSARNESFVVPYYNMEEEQRHLYLAIFIPISLSVFAFVALFVLLKFCNCKSGKDLVLNKSVSQLKLLDRGDSISGGKNNGSLKKKGSKKWKKRQRDADKKMNGVGASGSNGLLGPHSTTNTEGEGPYMNGSIPKANGHAFLQETISGLMGMQSPAKIHNNISKLPHQHDSFDKSFPYTNGSPLQQQNRKPRYAKKNEVKGPPTENGRGEQSLSHFQVHENNYYESTDQYNSIDNSKNVLFSKSNINLKDAKIKTVEDQV